MATENIIKILHLEDSPVDAELIRELILETGMKAEIELAEDRQQFETALKRGADYDLIITDFMLPRFNSFGALEVVRELCPHVPVICVSGAIGEETAIEVLKAGAVDYVLKDRLARLPTAIKRAIEVSRERRMRLVAEEENRTLSRALHQSPVLILVTGKDHRIKFVNRKVIQFTGYTFHNLVGREISVFAAGDASKQTFVKMQESIDKGGEFRSEFKGVKRNGDEFDASLIASPVLNEQGEVAYYLISIEDITPRKELEKKLVHEKEKAEAASRLKDAFISNLSHEIRTPLNGIIGMASIIEETFGPLSPGDNGGYFDSMEKSVRRLIKTVEMLLSISKVQLGDYPYHPEEFSLKYLLENVVSEFNEIADEKRLEIRTNFNAADPVVTADMEAMKDVFGYLLDNAIKYTKTGFIEISTGMDGDGIPFARVKDTGVGISEDYQKDLFSPFRQQESGIGRPFEGLGLGLPISKKLLDMNGCAIEVDSSTGKGTAITIRFLKVNFS